jgi:tetratricopeptide (TPR) repeat protein
MEVQLRSKMLTGILLVVLAFGCQKSDSQPAADVGKLRDYANALYNRQLYQQAAQEYNTILSDYQHDDSEAARLNYAIGNIYFERIRDYENALSYYLKIKHLYADSDLISEVNKKIVECLERLQRSVDAQQALDEATMLEPTQVKKSRPGAVVAKIGKRTITTGDLDFEISQLPPFMKSQLGEKSKKIDFLKQYIATELLYDSAKRKSLENDKSVIESTFQAKKNFMVQKLLEEEISKAVEIDESDVKLYYKAHRDKYSEKDDEGKVTGVKPFADVQRTVMQDLIRERQSEEYEKLIQRLMRAEAVQIYEAKLN